MRVPQLSCFEEWPKGLADCPSSRDIARILPGPRWMAIEGEQKAPLFLSTLLHGNEKTSFHVLSALANDYAGKRPPRSLLIFVGNVAAAALGKRVLDEQPDYNRIWHGGIHDQTPEHVMAEAVKHKVAAAHPFAAIDIHNTTGRNPHYGCVSSMRAADLYMLQYFADIGVYYQNPPTTLSIAFSKICPSITIECGQSGNMVGFNRALALVRHVLALDAFPKDTTLAPEFRLFETVGRVLVDPEKSISFTGDDMPDSDIVLDSNIEAFNFTDLPAKSVFARSNLGENPLRVINEFGENLTADFFDQIDGQIQVKRQVTPAMITSDTAIIRQDCLSYLMVPMDTD